MMCDTSRDYKSRLSTYLKIKQKNHTWYCTFYNTLNVKISLNYKKSTTDTFDLITHSIIQMRQRKRFLQPCTIPFISKYARPPNVIIKPTRLSLTVVGLNVYRPITKSIEIKLLMVKSNLIKNLHGNISAEITLSRKKICILFAYNRLI